MASIPAQLMLGKYSSALAAQSKSRAEARDLEKLVKKNKQKAFRFYFSVLLLFVKS
jgi:hypothetical protein